MKQIIQDRIAEVEAKLEARRGKGGYERNVEALETTLTELRRILSIAESRPA
jgi:hypothetical protein